MIKCKCRNLSPIGPMEEVEKLPETKIPIMKLKCKCGESIKFLGEWEERDKEEYYHRLSKDEKLKHYVPKKYRGS